MIMYRSVCILYACIGLLSAIQCFVEFNPFPNGQILDSSKLKEFADNNFKYDENGREFSKWLENTVGKGDIACYEQFLLFPQCFQETCSSDM